ncbi:lipopolysaccharide transport periplasmic protein LptA [Falsirhodobacter halotolerans]|uniref:lipopolysaccharide transport periplasmic protein LptA n=1 Tax=Falsirhodobacter halotolerans TaxID=1146892 RepID=UPI001FD0641F|nr:lipopolysaccharide transport periplasmic protein LptA [Falsirhodobacter halotolerans]MCJ8138368.1 lipopolysaccharide transport periplasmic protein LptA [Falsirhodobacter halotolerans]
MLKATILSFALALPVAATAQDTQIDLGGAAQDTSAPVGVDADQLSVDQAAGAATFTGNVRVAQGALRMAANEVRVEYGESQNEITALHATGGVTLANETLAAEGREASYTIASGQVVLSGDVVLTQGSSTIAGNRLTIDLASGSGRMEGRVQTLFQPGARQ